MNEPVQLIASGKSEADIALALKSEMQEKLQELCELCNRIERAGFVPSFGVGRDGFGRFIIQQIAIGKQF